MDILKVVCAAFSAVALRRSGLIGCTTLDLRPQDTVTFDEFYSINVGFFSYYSYMRIDTTPVVVRQLPHLISQTERGITFARLRVRLYNNFEPVDC